MPVISEVGGKKFLGAIVRYLVLGGTGPCFGKGGQSCVTPSVPRRRTKSNAAHTFLRITMSPSI